MKLCEIYDKIDAVVPKRLSDEYIAAYGGHDNSGILIDCGKEIAGADAAAVARARQAGAQVLVSADIKHNILCDALECGLKVVQLTHYASENYGFKILYKKLCGGLGVPCEYHEDEFLL